MTQPTKSSNPPPSGFEAAVLKLVQTLSQQAKPILGVLILVLVGVGLWQGQRYYHNYREMQAQEKIGPLFVRLDQKLQEKVEFEASQQKKADRQESEQSQPADSKKDLKPVTLEGDLLPLATTIKESLNGMMARQVAQLGAIQLADFYLENKKAEEAKDLLELAVKASPKNSWSRKMLQIQLSTVLIEMNEFEGALRLLEELDLGPAKDEPLKAAIELRRALLKDRLGQTEAAQGELLKISIDEDGEKSLKRATQLLRLQKLKQNLKPSGVNEASN